MSKIKDKLQHKASNKKEQTELIIILNLDLEF